MSSLGFPGGSVGKETVYNSGDPDLIPGTGRFPGGEHRAWQPTPVFLPGTSHGQRSLVDYSPWSLRRVGHN